MKNLKDYITSRIVSNWPSEPIVLEMANVASNVVLNRERYRVAVHGMDSGDRPYPHLHIYLYDDKAPYNKFNFEISIVDILCDDEINLIKMRDQRKHKLINNRNKCSWDGYTKLRDDFEYWLFDNNVEYKGDFIDNLDAVIYIYNRESSHPDNGENPILTYIENKGKKVLDKYKKYFEL